MIHMEINIFSNQILIVPPKIYLIPKIVVFLRVFKHQFSQWLQGILDNTHAYNTYCYESLQ